MRCPACDRELSLLTTGQLTVDVCRGGCGGIWFDHFELQKVDEPSELEGEALLNIEIDLEIQVDHQRRRACPKCASVVMMRHFVSDRRQVVVDECPSCGGVWLDAGELGAIRRETSTRDERQQAAQHYFRQVFSSNFLQQRPSSGTPPP